MIEIHELPDQTIFVDVDTSNYRDLSPPDIHRAGKRIRLIVSTSGLTPSEFTDLIIGMMHWAMYADVIIFIGRDGRQHILKDIMRYD